MRSVFAFVFSLLAGASLLSDSAFAADLDEIKARGVLRVAVSPLTPFVMKYSDGAYDGFEIESTEALSEHLGVSVEYIEKPFCNLVDAVINDEADIIASGFSNTALRRSVLAFSLPYHDTEYFLVMRKRIANKAETLRGLNRKDVRIGYQKGGVSGDIAQTEFYGADLTPFSSFAEILDAMKKNKIDGAVMFAPYPALARQIKNGDYRVVHRNALTRTIEAFGMSPDAEALRDEINGWIIERDLAGYWDELAEKWFDPDEARIGAHPRVSCPAISPTG